MKPIRSILFLGLVVIFIIAFWLKPGINTAKETTYVRYYEDTERKVNAKLLSDTLRRNRQRKIYKSERIHSKDRLANMKPSKFSRAMQFEELILVSSDTVLSIGPLPTDSVSSNPF
jgi:hypothetical protein